MSTINSRYFSVTDEQDGDSYPELFGDGKGWLRDYAGARFLTKFEGHKLHQESNTTNVIAWVESISIYQLRQNGAKVLTPSRGSVRGSVCQIKGCFGNLYTSDHTKIFCREHFDIYGEIRRMYKTVAAQTQPSWVDFCDRVSIQNLTINDKFPYKPLNLSHDIGESVDILFNRLYIEYQIRLLFNSLVKSNDHAHGRRMHYLRLCMLTLLSYWTYPRKSLKTCSSLWSYVRFCKSMRESKLRWETPWTAHCHLHNISEVCCTRYCDTLAL